MHSSVTNIIRTNQIVVSDKVTRTVEGIASNPDIPAIIHGETGTGKEEIAKLIHKRRCELSGRIIPCVPVNCALLSKSSLAQSKLFGHQKGAFTGAITTTDGFIGQANGGILFLDEAHTLSLENQQGLLRVMNDGSYYRVGGSQQLQSSFQTIVATTKNLEKEVEEGRFLLDLLTRIYGADIKLTPLREKSFDEIRNLIEVFFAQKKIIVPSHALNGITKRCQGYYWQGNIRLLFQALRLLVMRADQAGEGYTAEHLPELGLMYGPKKARSENYASKIMSEDGFGLKDAVASYERKLIKIVSEKTKTLGEAANLLNISRSSFDSKRKSYGLA